MVNQWFQLNRETARQSALEAVVDCIEQTEQGEIKIFCVFILVLGLVKYTLRLMLNKIFQLSAYASLAGAKIIIVKLELL
jgi:hypothetical protein